MSIFNRAILIIALLLLVTAARSDGIYNPTAGGMLNFSGNIGGFGGPSNPSGGGGGGGSACGTGVINLSTGCTQPMLGGL